MILFGYRPVQLAKGWGVEKDPEYAPVVEEMADRYLRYESIGTIVRWLNQSGVPCPKDVTRMRSANPKVRAKVSDAKWSTSTVRGILKSMAILGAVVNSKDEPLRDDQGAVIYRAEPLITRDQYERIQVRLSQNAPFPARVNSSLLGGIARCGECGAGLYRDISAKVRNGKTYSYGYYRCRDGRMNDGRCSFGTSFRGDPLEDIVTSTLLELAGHAKLRTERLIPGRDYSEEMARLIERTQHTQAEIGRARIARKDYSELQERLDADNAELDRLAALDPIPARKA